MVEPFTLAQSVSAIAVALFKKAAEGLGDVSAGLLIDALKKKLPEAAAHKALEELGRDPDNANLQAQLWVHLKSAMDQDHHLAPQLEQWLSESRAHSSGQNRLHMKGVATHGATVIQMGPGSSGNTVTISNSKPSQDEQ